MGRAEIGDAKPLNVSVVICAFRLDRWDETKRAIASVQEQTYPAREILLVIDEGSDALLRRARTDVAGVTIIVNKRPRLGGARLSGAEVATSPIIVFLDDDAVADRNWLAHLVEKFRDQRVLGAGGHIEPLWRGPRPAWFPSEFLWVVGCTYAGMPVRNGGEVRNLLGANMAVRADVIRRAGGFSAGWGGGSVSMRLGKPDRGVVVSESCEETEFCIRASHLFPEGIWLYCPEARIQHAVPTERATWRYFLARCRMEGRAKAALTGVAGSRDGLGSERRYVVTLAKSVLRDLVTGDLRRAVAIVVGLSVTASAYGRRRIARTFQIRAATIAKPA